MAENFSDAVLLELTKKDRELGLSLIYEKYYGNILQFVTKMIWDLKKAEDITQSCFLSFIENLDKIDTNKLPLKAYLFGIAQNKLCKENSSRKMEYDLELAQNVADDVNQLKLLLSQELSQQVNAVLSMMDPSHREILLLYDDQELSLVEIAFILKETPIAIKGRVQRARAYFRNLMLQYLEQKNALSEGKITYLISN